MRPPSVDALSKSLSDIDLPSPLLVEAARIAIGNDDPQSARDEAVKLKRQLLGPVSNAIGVLLHTNLGRAQLAYQQASQATNLEFD